MRRKLIVAVLKTVWLYASLAFLYVGVTAVLRPRQLGRPVWHAWAWPHKDTFGVIAFVASFVCFLALGLLGERPVVWGLARRRTDENGEA